MSQGFAKAIPITQNVIPSAANSSTTDLDAGNAYTFTGTGISTLGVNGIQVSLFADQNCTILVEQSPDNVNWDLQDSFNYYASENFGTTVQAISSYTRVIVTTASLTTTVFRLQTVLCPIVDPLPRALDPEGHLITVCHGYQDKYDFLAVNTPTGETRAVTPMRLVGSNFEGTTVDANFWIATTANAATVAQANAQIVLSSGVNAADSAQLHSLRRARYVGGSSMVWRAVSQLGDTGIANNTRRWGVAWGATMPTITDGAWFQLSGTTFSIVTFKGSAPTTVSSGAFNGVQGLTYSPGTSIRTYEIIWTNSKVYFVVDGVLLHTISATAATWANTVNHHIYLSNINSGNTTNVTLTCRVASIRRLGALGTQPTSYYQAGTVAAQILKYGPGNVHELLVSGVTNNSVITLYDNTAASGTILFSTGSMGATTTPFALDFKGAPFFTGLTLVIATANSNATVIYE